MIKISTALIISIVSVVFGWLLSNLSQLFFDLRNRKKERREREQRAVVDFSSAIAEIYAYLKNSYLLASLKNSYIQRTLIAKEERSKEVYADMKGEYHRLSQKDLDYKLRETEIMANVNRIIQNCAVAFRNDGKFITWVANRGFEFKESIVPDFSQCLTHEDVAKELKEFHDSTLAAEMNKLNTDSNEIKEYLAKKYIGRFIDVSMNPWYSRWFHWLLIRYFGGAKKSAKAD